MAKTYFETGALVKLYIVENGSTFVQGLADGTFPVSHGTECRGYNM